MPCHHRIIEYSKSWFSDSDKSALYGATVVWKAAQLKNSTNTSKKQYVNKIVKTGPFKVANYFLHTSTLKPSDLIALILSQSNPVG